MIPCMSVSDRYWRQWFAALSDTPGIRDVELSADLLESEPAVVEAVEQHGFHIHAVRDLLPASIARYLADTSPPVRDAVTERAAAVLRQCDGLGANAVMLDLGIGSIRKDQIDEQMRQRSRLLTHLVASTEDSSLTLSLPVRYPRPYPGSREWEYTANLVHDVMHPRCRLALNIFPAEEDFQLERLMRSIYFRTCLIRFHYEPAAGESVEDWFSQDWHNALERHGIHGPLVFCPRLRSEDAIPEACRRVARLAGQSV